VSKAEKEIRSTGRQKAMGMVEIDTGHGCIEMDMDADEFGYEDVHCPGIWTLATVDSD